MAEGFKTSAGAILPYRQWHKVGKDFSIMPLKTTAYLRRDSTGEVCKPKGWGPKRDAIRMGLYMGELPAGLVSYQFGADALEGEAGPFSKFY